MDKEQFVADGKNRIKESEEYKKNVIEIHNFMNEKYREEIARANIIRRSMLILKMRGEIKREIDKLAPDDGLYFNRS